MARKKAYTPTRFMLPTSHYDKAMADRAVAFIQCLSHTKGDWCGRSFQLLPWQETIIRDLFGVVKEDGTRQFRTAYVETGKKSGKTELAAAIALYLLAGDGEQRAEVYGAAADRQQASLVFDVAADMVRMCPALRKRIKILDSRKRLVFMPTNSFYQVLSADAHTKHGFNAHGVIIDELHCQPDDRLFNVLTKGAGDARRQNLTFLITTAGDNLHSICYQQHEKAGDILDGRKTDPTFYPCIYGADLDDDWTDEKVWAKANPSLGVTFSIDKLREACESAKQNPAEEYSFRQLRLCQWQTTSVRWMPMAKWDACAKPTFTPESLRGRTCYAGLDLSSTTDLTALVLVFPPVEPDEPYKVLPFAWIPADAVEQRSRRDHVNYSLWAKQGFIQTTEGNVVDYDFIEQFILRLRDQYDIREIAYDRWNSQSLVTHLMDEGLTMVPFGQGFVSMSAPTKELMRLTLENRLAHNGHPVLRWCMNNVVVKVDPSENIKIDKGKATERVDCAVALVMALDRAIRNEAAAQSVYENRGLLFI